MSAPHLLPIVHCYAWPLSARAGDEIKLYLSSPDKPATKVDYSIVRRTRTSSLDGEVVSRGQVPGMVPSYPVPEDAPQYGCRWPSAFNITLDPSWPSAVYEFRFSFADGSPTNPHSRCMFVVRPGGANRTSPAKILMALATNTYAGGFESGI